MILVVGVGRTGTSVVAQVLEERLGVSMGGRGEVRDATPEGDWEDQEFKALNWKHITREIDAQEWKVRARLLAANREEPWGLKHPAMSEFLDIALEAFPEASVIWCQRDRYDTWQSWCRHFLDPSPDRMWARINFRHWAIALALVGKDHLQINMTEHKTGDYLAQALGEGLEQLTPGILKWESSQS